MLGQIKSLIVALVLGGLVFVVAKPVWLKFMAQEDFRRRRGVWLFLTVCVFLSPNLWIYALIAAPTLLWAVSKDPNPAALYAALLFVAPAGGVFIPKLIELNHQVLLAICVALPALAASRGTAKPGMPRQPEDSSGALPSVLLFLFCTIQTVLFIRYESWTNVLRREISILLMIFVPFLLFRRGPRNLGGVREAVACLALSGAIMVPLAAFESVKGWQVYLEQARVWGAEVNPFSYLMRAGQLRAMVATGHSLDLGYVFAMCFCFCLYMQRVTEQKWQRVAIVASMWIGLLAAYSRGAWVTAIAMMMAYLWLGPGGGGRVVKAVSVLGLLGLAVSSTGFGQRIIDSLPFIGTVDTANTEYRQRLFTRSLELIPDHPWFGDLLVKERMQDLMQGQGIIDLVNGYLKVALLNGLVTLAVLLLFLLIVTNRTISAARRMRQSDPDSYMLGMNMAACVVGTLLFAWGAGFPNYLWLLAGLCTAYAGMTNHRQVGAGYSSKK